MSDGPEETEPVRVERPATGGAVGRLGDGRVVFVRHALPGELVRVRVTDRTSTYARADAVEVLEASAERVNAPCEYARPGACGGCDLQHASVRAQSDWKAAIVAGHLTRLARLDREVAVVAPDGPARGSRTRLRCAVTPDGSLALRAARSHDLIEIASCWIADERMAPAFATHWGDAVEVELRAIGDGEPFAVVRRATPRGPLDDVRSLTGAPLAGASSRVEAAGHHYTVSPRSFWQAHRAAPALLVDAVRSRLGAGPGDTVVDLYSGVGLFAVALARDVGPSGRVVAVESSPAAVRDARSNADGLSQVKVREWSVAPRAVNDAVSSGDLVVVDPPRQGLARGVAGALVRRAPRRIVYVSCDAATFARDLAHLGRGGYELTDLAAFDLFPMTEHVEIVATLDRVA